MTSVWNACFQGSPLLVPLAAIPAGPLPAPAGDTTQGNGTEVQGQQNLMTLWIKYILMCQQCDDTRNQRLYSLSTLPHYLPFSSLGSSFSEPLGLYRMSLVLVGCGKNPGLLPLLFQTLETIASDVLLNAQY